MGIMRFLSAVVEDEDGNEDWGGVTLSAGGLCCDLACPFTGEQGLCSVRDLRS
jgi:hypothetical protein